MLFSKSRHLNLLVILIFISCAREECESEIVIERFRFCFPRDFSISSSPSFNSEIGKIHNSTGSTVFLYEASGHIRAPIKSLEQFLKDKDWEPSVFLELSVEFGVTELSRIKMSEVKRITRDASEKLEDKGYYVTCTSGDLTFDVTIKIPDRIRYTQIIKDSVNGCYSELYIPRSETKGILGIYIEPDGFRTGKESSLSIICEKLSQDGGMSQDSVVQLLKAFNYSLR